MVRLMPDGQNMQFTPDIMEVFWNNKGNDVLSALFDNLAISLTNNIRKTSDQSKSFAGEEGIRTPIFQIDWKWIIPSAICIVMAWIFLFCAWWQTRKTNTPIWKGSLLAVLFHGLSVELKRSVPEQYLQSEMSKEADRIMAKLEEIDGGICLHGELMARDEESVKSLLLSTAPGTAQDAILDSVLKLVPNSQ